LSPQIVENARKPDQMYGNILRGARTKCLPNVGFAERSIKLPAIQQIYPII